MARAGTVLGWALPLCCVPVAAVRLLGLDSQPATILLAALVPLVLLVAYPVLIGAAITLR